MDMNQESSTRNGYYLVLIMLLNYCKICIPVLCVYTKVKHRPKSFVFFNIQGEYKHVTEQKTYGMKTVYII